MHRASSFTLKPSLYPERGNIPGIVNPTVNAKGQEHVEIQPNGVVILGFAVAHPVYYIRFVQLRFQLVPKTTRYCRGPEKERQVQCLRRAYPKHTFKLTVHWFTDMRF